ncbi:hypothetical protein X975_11848, partial [Stegodyphus mimosarum]
MESDATPKKMLTQLINLGSPAERYDTTHRTAKCHDLPPSSGEKS